MDRATGTPFRQTCPLVCPRASCQRDNVSGANAILYEGLIKRTRVSKGPCIKGTVHQRDRASGTPSRALAAGTSTLQLIPEAHVSNGLAISELGGFHSDLCQKARFRLQRPLGRGRAKPLDGLLPSARPLQRHLVWSEGGPWKRCEASKGSLQGPPQGPLHGPLERARVHAASGRPLVGIPRSLRARAMPACAEKPSCSHSRVTMQP
ncbi:hypothetical protein M885DRAFT_16521 [Pelagophyceae sp. CCMP2097]|nr:hypothetical protein M885DRAFT_16521 [Pelagophyceae sp. CCMP2097]